MIHKGVEFTVTQAAPGVWRWQFRIGDKVKSGKTEAKLHLLAIRRVQLRIDRETYSFGPVNMNPTKCSSQCKTPGPGWRPKAAIIFSRPSLRPSRKEWAWGWR